MKYSKSCCTSQPPPFQIAIPGNFPAYHNQNLSLWMKCRAYQMTRMGRC